MHWYSRIASGKQGYGMVVLGGVVSGGCGVIGGFRGVWGADVCVLGLNQGCVKM